MKFPANSAQSTVAESHDAATTEEFLPHEVECEVLHRLQNHPALKFTRLSVHQCDRDSIFLDGSLESNDDEIDLCEVVRGIHGIKIVVNRVMNIHPRPRPKKG
jgi:hypothetical protein